MRRHEDPPISPQPRTKPRTGDDPLFDRVYGSDGHVGRFDEGDELGRGDEDRHAVEVNGEEVVPPSCTVRDGPTVRTTEDRDGR